MVNPQSKADVREQLERDAHVTLDAETDGNIGVLRGQILGILLHFMM